MTYWFTRYKYKFTEVDYSLFLTYSVLVGSVGKSYFFSSFIIGGKKKTISRVISKGKFIIRVTEVITLT